MKKLNKISNELKLILLYSTFLFLCRIIPHLPNFTPVFAIIIFSSKFKFNFYSKNLLILIPMLISDIFLGFYIINMYLYVSYILLIFLSNQFKSIKFQDVILKSLSYNLIFFLITNFGVWRLGKLYSENLNGLIETYVMGIPFFGYSIISTVFFLAIFFILETNLSFFKISQR